MKYPIKTISLIVALSVLSFSTSFAKTKSKKSTKGGKTQVLNFEDELIKGEAQKPELFYLLERKQYNFKKLIRLRENFLPEMERDSEQIEASGSGS